MSVLLKNNQPLSYYLENAIERVKENNVDRTKSGMLHVYHDWKNMAKKQEKQIKELEAALKTIAFHDIKPKTARVIKQALK